MATKERAALTNLWEAAERRTNVLQAHPHLAALEDEVSLALRLFAAGQGDDQAVASARDKRSQYLREHGLPLDYAEPRWSCADCQDESYVGGKPCHCRQQAELAHLLGNSGLPPKLRTQTFARFDLSWYSGSMMTPLGISERHCASYALNTCQKFVASVMEGQERSGLFISGEPGLGKTFLLSSICNSLLAARVPTLYVVFCDLIAAIKDTFNAESSGTTESRIMTAAREADVLLLDDLGAEQVTEFVTNRLFDIVNYRCNHQKPLVVSSNLKVSEIGRLYGERIASRLWEMCEVVALYGEDIRIQKKRQG
ncbi:MAG: ATP-binding protein [Firmicutes bacterium]|nr:ATP-binding protein [Dethiobacter sp.]MBS3888163.1 ATP-binding protein [Bacillota bacterium]MBS4054349.1 ATP-binding protein [Thermaerobacter sp.]